MTKIKIQVRKKKYRNTSVRENTPKNQKKKHQIKTNKNLNKTKEYEISPEQTKSWLEKDQNECTEAKIMA